MNARARQVRGATGKLDCQFDGCAFVIASASPFEELVHLQRHRLRWHHVDLTLAEVREERAAWERRDEASPGGAA